jgi:hypothetical protein
MTFEELVKETATELAEFEGELEQMCVEYRIDPHVVYKATKRNLDAVIIMIALAGDSVSTLEAFGCTMMTLGIAIGQKMGVGDYES